MRPGAGFPPRARQAAQPPEIDQVHRCTPDPGRYAERGDAPVYTPPRPQDWADAGMSHRQQPQNHGRNDEPDPFLVVREPSVMHGIHGPASLRPDPTEQGITSTA